MNQPAHSRHVADTWLFQTRT